MCRWKQVTAKSVVAYVSLMKKRDLLKLHSVFKMVSWLCIIFIHDATMSNPGVAMGVGWVMVLSVPKWS